MDLDALLSKLPGVKISVIGDLCLDAYWDVDMQRSEASVETGLPTHSVRGQRYSLGGAGNVARNLTALGVAAVSVYGVAGSDPFGYQMRELMRALGIRTDGMLEQSEDWVTHTYIKPTEQGTRPTALTLAISTAWPMRRLAGWWPVWAMIWTSWI